MLGSCSAGRDSVGWAILCTCYAGVRVWGGGVQFAMDHLGCGPPCGLAVHRITAHQGGTHATGKGKEGRHRHHLYGWSLL